MALRSCPDCGAEISNHASACPKCGRYIWTTARTTLAIAFLLLIFVSFSFTYEYVPGIIASVTGTRTLRSGGVMVPVAASREACLAWIQSRASNDKWRQNSLALSNYIYSVESGTKVQVLEKNELFCRVKVMEGYKKGLIGWVSMSDIQ